MKQIVKGGDALKYLTFEYAKESKLDEISSMCNATIEAGFDIRLSDGTISHFSLTEYDQINLLSLTTMVFSGKTKIPYHADGEICKYYSADDILLIMEAANNHKMFHVTYHNSLKAYVSSLKDIDSISDARYGMNIPNEYQSDVLKEMYQTVVSGDE